MVVCLKLLMSGKLALDHALARCADEAPLMHWLALDSDISVHLVADHTPSTKLLLIASRVVRQVVLRACVEGTLQDNTASCTFPAACMPAAAKRSERAPRKLCFAASSACSLTAWLYSSSSSWTRSAGLINLTSSSSSGLVALSSSCSSWDHSSRRLADATSGCNCLLLVCCC